MYAALAANRERMEMAMADQVGELQGVGEGLDRFHPGDWSIAQEGARVRPRIAVRATRIFATPIPADSNP